MPQTINIIKAYLNDYGLFSETKISSPLFFNKSQEKLTRAGISYIVNKNAETARKNILIYSLTKFHRISLDTVKQCIC